MADDSPGLAGVIAGESSLSRIDFERNRLILRGYDLEDLVGKVRFEEVAFLILHGDLPTAAQLADFEARLQAERQLPDYLMTLLRAAPAEAHPMALMRTAVSALGMTDPEAGDISRDASRRKAERLLAKIPTILTAGHRCGQGLEPVAPRADLGHAANLLYMLEGEVPAAWVVPANGTACTVDGLEAACRAGLASFKVPRHFELVERLPRNALGKVQKHLLPGS